MSAKELVALLDGIEVGRVHRDSRGRLTFIYDDAWRNGSDSYPISLSMPLTAAEHPNPRIEAFLWGLLPENERVIERWARKFHVARNAFSLLAHVGQDCPGAIQLATPETVDELRASARGRVEWLTEANVAERLRLLRKDVAAWRLAGDSGQFSLAGEQSKTALLRQGDRWGIPSGRLPTTHILKPPLPDLEGHVENEHFCLALAREVGLPTAWSEVRHFQEEVVIVVERYDRVRVGRSLVRVHQEDACQALGALPSKKYESQGGPGARSIVALLRTSSTSPPDDVWTFVRALGFAWLTGATDAHAKNYSLLLTPGPRVRLAPLYDLASVLPYPEFQRKKLKLAMRIGKKYRLDEIGIHQWVDFARELRLDAPQMVERLRAMAGELPERALEVMKRAQREGLTSPILDTLAKEISARARKCRADLDRSARRNVST